MRLLALFVTFALFAAQPVQALTACPATVSVIAFEPNSTILTSAARETVEATYIRATQCEWPVFTLLSSGGDPLGRERARTVQTELVALGLSVAIPFAIGEDERAPDGSSPPDRVIVLVDYDN
ncbi:MAG: hypothetical protein R3C27_03010 [Hyphomonadaceae bacterium]